MAKRKIKQISRIQPIQRDTAIVVPHSYILGGFEKAIDVVGTNLSKVVTVARKGDTYPVYDGQFRITCTEAKKVTVKDMTTGTTTAVLDATSANVVVDNLIPGITLTIASGLANVVVNDVCDIYINGDSTYIVPGTILGRIKEGEVNEGLYEPIKTDTSKYDVFRVCGGTLETNRNNLVSPISEVMVVADTYSVDVYIFAQVIESVCKSINMTDAVKAKLTGIVWE